MIEHAAGRAEPKSSLFSDSSDISYTLMKVIGVSERNPGSERGRIIYSDEDLIDQLGAPLLQFFTIELMRCVRCRLVAKDERSWCQVQCDVATRYNSYLFLQYITTRSDIV